MHNILIIVQNLPVPFDRRVWQEARTLHQAGFGVTVICPKSQMYFRGYELMEGIEVYRYPLLIEADRSVFAYCLEFLYCWLATSFLACTIYIKRPFSLIHACNPPDTYFGLALLFRLLGVKYVFDHHDLCPDLCIAKGNKNRLVYFLLMCLEWITYRTADVVITTNESYRSIAKTRGNLDDRSIQVVRSAPSEAWANSRTPLLSLKRGHKYLVLFVGQIATQDGVDYLLRSIQVYHQQYANDTQFVIVGDGPARQQMQRLATSLGVADCTEFTGRIADEKLRECLSTADVCVDPAPGTQFNNLSTMNKIIEYMAFGRPIVAFDLLETRRSALEAARYVEPNDVAHFAREIRELLENEARRQYMSQFGMERFRTVLAWEKSEESLLRAYASALEVEVRGMSKHELLARNS
jgi:glycosyltransferase involved in cell wall biosynthesis